jgi:hypothetical protein
MRMAVMTGLCSAVLAGALLTSPATASEPGQTFGVYVRVLDAPVDAYGGVTAALPDLLAKAGWQLQASYDAGTGDCGFKARVYVVTDPTWTAALSGGGADAAFVMSLRIAVYQDELGTHVSLANPQSLARTIVGETGYERAAAEVVARLQSALAPMPGKVVTVQYGQMRDQGLIGKTMGVVAGGPFPSKVEDLGSTAATSTVGVAEVAAAFAAAARTPTKRWGIHTVYQVDLPGGNLSIIGLAGDKMEAKAYAIVGHGGDESREAYSCPGIDHAPAFPLEVVVLRDGDKVELRAVDAMFRMKMYFEDAGTMKFAANMAMPGSIENEIRDLVEDALDALRGRTASR